MGSREWSRMCIICLVAAEKADGLGQSSLPLWAVGPGTHIPPPQQHTNPGVAQEGASMSISGFQAENLLISFLLFTTLISESMQEIEERNIVEWEIEQKTIEWGKD